MKRRKFEYSASRTAATITAFDPLLRPKGGCRDRADVVGNKSTVSGLFSCLEFINEFKVLREMMLKRIVGSNPSPSANHKLLILQCNLIGQMGFELPVFCGVCGRDASTRLVGESRLGETRRR